MELLDSLQIDVLLWTSNVGNAAKWPCRRDGSHSLLLICFVDHGSMKSPISFSKITTVLNMKTINLDDV